MTTALYVGWMRGADDACFRFINHSLANPVFDWLMPFASHPPGGIAVATALAITLAAKGGARGRLCVGMFLLTLWVGNFLVVDPLKELVARPRPFFALGDARLVIGRVQAFSMPSAHSANWFGAAMIGFVYYRRQASWLFALAALVAFSRVYNGVHYPTDVLAGAVIGAGTAVATAVALDTVWQFAGPRWFQEQWARLPSLVLTEEAPRAAKAPIATAVASE